MPFKLKLKKSRHYSVVSKSLFVISVEILDGTTVECTLSSESTGQDCLDVVCQKLSLNQPKFFGLQYISRNSDSNLCWLELDRPLKRQLDKYAKGLCVCLRVMYYVISGVRLFNDEVTRYHYFLQLKQDVIEGRISCNPQQAVELASYSMQAEFGNFDAERHTAHYLKDFQLFPKTFTDSSLLETLTEAASRQHAALHNLPQGTAEEYYICACQRLEGYGQEIYAVKDQEGNDILIGICLTGVYAGYPGKEGRHFSWSDISNVINHKRDFTIESVGGTEKVEFQFSDVESAKNAWRFCVLQHIFFRQYENNVDNEKALPKPPVFQQNEDKLRQKDSYEDVTNTSLQWDRPVSSLQNLTHRAQSTSCLDLNKQTDVDTLRSFLPSYRPAPDYETAIQQKYRNSSGAITSRGPLRNTHPILYSSQPEIHQSDTYPTHLHYPDVTHNNIEQKNLLCNNAFGQSQIVDNMGMLHVYKSPPPYPTNKISSNSTPDLAGMSQQIKPHTGFVSNIVSGSSPDLVSGGNLYLRQLYPGHSAHPVHRSHSYLPPQHGTYENLASIFNNNMLGRPQAVIVENPNITKHIKKVYDEHGNIIYCMPANMKQILQENQLPSTGFVVTRNQNAMVAHDHHNSTEPIYENIPLPWQNDGEMRARTQSIHSAPEISQVVNHSVVNAVQSQLQKLNINNQRGSRENLYVNIDGLKSSSKTDLNTHNSSTHNLNESGRSGQLFDNSQMSNIQNVSDSSKVIDTSYVKPSSSLNTTRTSFETNNSLGNDNFNDSTSTSNTSSTKTKKKRWGILMGRSKSGEKIKSATLGREKKKKDEDQNQGNNKHRWSTGLPRFNPLPPSISKETMCQLLENKLADSQLFFEFDKIPKKKQNAEFKTALLSENAAFNRFKDVLPYEDNRLRLIPTKNNKYGYINASHITASVGSKQRFYIAAQGPTRQTLPHFWQCIWEAEVYLIVQLTDPTEDLSYLPDAGERCIDVDQDYQIWWEFSQKTGHCVTSKVRLCHVASRRYRTIWHLHYTDWGDQGCPNSVAHFLGFLEEMQSVHQHSIGEIPPGHNKNPPILVHCTAGVGRTGLTILCDLLLYTVDHNQEVCIPRVVGLLRQQRAYMIQTIAQYRFVYSLLIHYLKQTRLI
ncbi:tyrosine-protein phosphatase non-receptor type 14 isoform X1 [Diorhabda carinulata]|uniref:tyrosine-protein phosphatase non-receptor type 14 isoform X1 n=1 Tax=Diorhabda carinulata TaxID=1163345 RepID=UPI0025A0DD78|nr:tyrosine-protein phosphatase non-receptor type 14 isoform X1 [Diorhabda carinulata]XP_057669757.1 tyrosine-protein phosphatase non-receptor type 14 isoform X1 [Diorhabda carinulata]